MKIIGIGIDIINKKRFNINNIKLIKKILSPKELIFFKKIKNNNMKKTYLANRWSCKEAIYKALNVKKSFNNITIYDYNCIPYTKSFSLYELFISISDSEKYSISQVIAFKKYEK